MSMVIQQLQKMRHAIAQLQNALASSRVEEKTLKDQVTEVCSYLVSA